MRTVKNHSAKPGKTGMPHSHTSFTTPNNSSLGVKNNTACRKPGKAVECAIDMQHILKDYNTAKADEVKILLCVGIGYGAMLLIGNDVFGAQVNASSKVGEDAAKPYEILVTDAFRDAIGELNGISYEPMDIVPPGANSAYRIKYQLA